MKFIVTTEIEVDHRRLPEYARLARKKCGLKKNEPVHMVDIINQAIANGDVAGLTDVNDVDGFAISLTQEEILELSA